MCIECIENYSDVAQVQLNKASIQESPGSEYHLCRLATKVTKAQWNAPSEHLHLILVSVRCRSKSPRQTQTQPPQADRTI